jgi:hypothetical protein
MRGGAQRGLGLGVSFGFVVHKKHRPAQHGTRGHGVAGFGLGQVLEVAQVAGDHIAVTHGAAAADVGALVQQAGAQDALHGTHQPAVDAFHIGCHGCAAVQALGVQLLRRCVGAVEHRGGHGRLAGLQRHQAHPCRPWGKATAELEVPKSMATKPGRAAAVWPCG